MHGESGTDTTGTKTRQLFIDDIAVPYIQPFSQAAVGLRITHGKHAHFSSLGEDLIRNLVILLPLVGIGHQLGINKPAQLIAPSLMIFRQIGIG